jgi:hypothetical protein
LIDSAINQGFIIFENNLDQLTGDVAQMVVDAVEKYLELYDLVEKPESTDDEKRKAFSQMKNIIIYLGKLDFALNPSSKELIDNMIAMLNAKKDSPPIKSENKPKDAVNDLKGELEKLLLDYKKQGIKLCAIINTLQHSGKYKEVVKVVSEIIYNISKKYKYNHKTLISDFEKLSGYGSVLQFFCRSEKK